MHDELDASSPNCSGSSEPRRFTSRSATSSAFLCSLSPDADDDLSRRSSEPSPSMSRTARPPSSSGGLVPLRGATPKTGHRGRRSPPGEPLPPYNPHYDPPQPAAFVSFAVGVALGRFGAGGEGIFAVPPTARSPPASSTSRRRASATASITPPPRRSLAAWDKHRETDGKATTFALPPQALLRLPQEAL